MKTSNKTLALFVLLITGIILMLLQWFSTGINVETDSITHYQLARYAFKYPENFVDHWGKPLFTILAAPMAQFGYNGAIVFNLGCGLLSAWFAFLIAQKMGFRYAWVAIIFTIFTPVYLIVMFSSLTEILFSLVLISAIYLFISERFIWSAIVISFIPFVRTEGLMFIILFIPALVWMKRYKSLPYLVTGFILFSSIGWPLYQDPLWFFTKMPYGSSNPGLYGSGSFWYYFLKMRNIMNLPLIFLFITGLLAFVLKAKENIQNPVRVRFATFYILIIPSFFGFVLVHSFLWWQGMWGVLASTRFIAGVLPLSALIALSGFEWIIDKVKKRLFIMEAFGIITIATIIYMPSRYNQLPMKTGRNFAVMQKLTDWLKTTPDANTRSHYSDPMFPFYMGIDPFDNQRCVKVYSYENIDPAVLIKTGEILIWDSQFAGQEGQLPFDSIVKNRNFQLIKTFVPIQKFNIIGNEKYFLAVFIKK